MMSSIQLMNDKLANLIAAGEVIERPSSVIKELVENSIDAKATSIFIGVLEAGKKEIIVKDDGIGMDRIDAENCFLRHASSKVKNEFDLNHIRTLGFRGEAIPSIAAVSRVELLTSLKNEPGVLIISTPSSPLVKRDALSIDGTMFKVNDLFFNTPARLKYLKSDRAEISSIIDVIEKFAISYPEIAFELAIDNKVILKTNGRGNILECITKIYGIDVNSLYEIKNDSLNFSFKGYIGKPDINYSTKNKIVTFLNRRYIYSFPITKGIIDAFSDYLAPIRYPLCVLDISIDSALVDVNVHPSKKQVRISIEDEIVSKIKKQIVETLKSNRPVYSFSDVKEKTSVPSFTEKKEEYSSSSLFDTYAKELFEKKKESISHEKNSEEYYLEAFDDESEFSLEDMEPIGQILETYIICKTKEGMSIIDQHAAAERINYEKTEHLFKTVKKSCIPLIPLIFEFSSSEINNLDEKKMEEFSSLLFKVERFGDKMIKVSEVPVFLNAVDNEYLIRTITSTILNCKDSDFLSHYKEIIESIACHMSIKGNSKLNYLEMTRLIKDLSCCKNPANCPHGRPTIIRLSKKSIEKIFKRSGF